MNTALGIRIKPNELSTLKQRSVGSSVSNLLAEKLSEFVAKGEVEVEPKERGVNTSIYLDIDLLAGIQRLAEKTKLPVSRIIDAAVKEIIRH